MAGTFGDGTQSCMMKRRQRLSENLHGLPSGMKKPKDPPPKNELWYWQDKVLTFVALIIFLYFVSSNVWQHVKGFFPIR